MRVFEQVSLQTQRLSDFQRKMTRGKCNRPSFLVLGQFLSVFIFLRLKVPNANIYMRHSCSVVAIGMVLKQNMYIRVWLYLLDLL